MALNQEEKRRFPRVPLQTPLCYRIRGQVKCGNTISQDISVGGLSFSSGDFVSPGVPLMLEFGILSRVLRPIGRVVWATPMPHSDRNRMGVEFVEFDPGEKRYLEDYLDMQLEKF